MLGLTPVEHELLTAFMGPPPTDRGPLTFLERFALKRLLYTGRVELAPCAGCGRLYPVVTERGRQAKQVHESFLALKQALAS
jgi:hypothetical protein